MTTHRHGRAPAASLLRFRRWTRCPSTAPPGPRRSAARAGSAVFLRVRLRPPPPSVGDRPETRLHGAERHQNLPPTRHMRRAVMGLLDASARTFATSTGSICVWTSPTAGRRNRRSSNGQRIRRPPGRRPCSPSPARAPSRSPSPSVLVMRRRSIDRQRHASLSPHPQAPTACPGGAYSPNPPSPCRPPRISALGRLQAPASASRGHGAFPNSRRPFPVTG